MRNLEVRGIFKLLKSSKEDNRLFQENLDLQFEFSSNSNLQ